MMNMLSPLFELDPLFRRTFLFCVPPVAFSKIATSGLFPPVEVCTTLARGLSVKDYVMPDEVSSFLISCFVSFHFFLHYHCTLLITSSAEISIATISRNRPAVDHPSRY